MGLAKSCCSFFCPFMIHCNNLKHCSALGAGAGMRDWPRVLWGRGSAHHLLAPLTLAGFLQASSRCLNWQCARRDGGKQAATAVNRESQIHRRLQQHLQEKAEGPLGMSLRHINVPNFADATCATKGVMSAPTLAIPLLVPKPKALVAVGYTCWTSENTVNVLLQ